MFTAVSPVPTMVFHSWAVLKKHRLVELSHFKKIFYFRKEGEKRTRNNVRVKH